MNSYFDLILGQERAVKNLTSLYTTRRIPHALLFYGPEGTGKFFTALQLVKLLNQTENNPSLGKKINSISEPLVKYIFPLPRGKGESNEDSGTEKLTQKQIEALQTELDKKRKNPYYKIKLENANNIKISSIREIRKFLSLDYSEYKYRLILIEDAHLMNTESQNALLKSLEEPPEGIIIILTTPYQDKLLPTIKSRCWQVKFDHLSNEIVEKLLVGRFDVSSEEAETAALFSGGSVLRAVNLLDKNLKSILESTIQILRFSLGNWLNSAFIELQNVIDNYDKDTLKDVMLLILTWLNDVQKERFDFDNYYFRDFKDTLTKFNTNFPNRNIEEAYVNIDKLLQSVDNNVLLNVISLNLILQLNSIARR